MSNSFSSSMEAAAFDSATHSTACRGSLSADAPPFRPSLLAFQAEPGSGATVSHETASRPPPIGSTNKPANIIIRNFSADVDDAALERLMRVFGEVESTRVVRDSRTGASRRVGFVKFATHESAATAKSTLNGNPVQPEELDASGAVLRYEVDFSMHSGEVQRSHALHVRNIPIDRAMEADVFFRSLGLVTSLQIRQQKGQRQELMQKYMCDVEYQTIEDADRALKQIHNNRFFDADVPLLAKFAEPKEARDVRNERRRMLHGGGPSAADSSPSAAAAAVSEQGSRSHNHVVQHGFRPLGFAPPGMQNFAPGGPFLPPQFASPQPPFVMQNQPAFGQPGATVPTMLPLHQHGHHHHHQQQQQHYFVVAPPPPQQHQQPQPQPFNAALPGFFTQMQPSFAPQFVPQPPAQQGGFFAAVPPPPPPQMFAPMGAPQQGFVAVQPTQFNHEGQLMQLGASVNQQPSAAGHVFAQTQQPQQSQQSQPAPPSREAVQQPVMYFAAQ